MPVTSTNFTVVALDHLHPGAFDLGPVWKAGLEGGCKRLDLDNMYQLCKEKNGLRC